MWLLLYRKRHVHICTHVLIYICKTNIFTYMYTCCEREKMRLTWKLNMKNNSDLFIHLLKIYILKKY